MQLRLVKYSIVFLLFFSCKPKLEENEVVPSHILSEERFTEVLVDSYLAEGASGINVKNVAGEKFEQTYAFNALTDNHVRKAQFDSSIVYYSGHPRKLKIIYDKVLEKLSEFQTIIMVEKNLHK